MSNILSQNNIRYQIDNFAGYLYGVISSNSDINLSRATSVKAINISGSQPEGSSRYIAFCIDNQWGKILSDGSFSQFDNNSVSFDNLANFANTPQELSALSNIPCLAGKFFRIALALATENIDYGVPSLGISFQCVTGTQQLIAIEYSPEYELGDNSQIATVSSDTSVQQGGSVNLQARIKTNNDWSSWAALDAFSGLKAQAIQFMAECKVVTPGTSTVKVNSVSAVYSDGSSIVSGISKGEVISLTEDWYMPVKTCRLTVKHSPLVNSILSAYIAFRKSPVQVTREQLGIGSGGRKTFQLKNTNGLKYDTLKIYYDNIQYYTDYEFNCEAGRVTCTAPEGVIVTCDYEYGWESEDWQEMNVSSRFSMGDYDQTEYKFSGNHEGKSVCALKLVLTMTSGRIDNERLGTATGSTQSFRLSHRIDDGKITLNANGATLSPKNWTLLDDPQYIAVSAPLGRILYASYDWISEPVKIYQYYAVYSE